MSDDTQQQQPGAALDEPVVVKRTRRAPFIPPSPDSGGVSGVAITRNWAAARSSKKPTGITRNRVIAGDLPEWVPLPPGELQVDRQAGKQH